MSTLYALPIAFIFTGTALVGFITQMVLSAAVTTAIGFGINLAFAEDPQSSAGKPGTLAAFDLPTTEEGRAIQIIVGSPRIKGYNDLWHGDLGVKAITEKVKKNTFGNHKNVTVGYLYYLGFQYGWCAHAEELLELRMDEQTITPVGAPITANTTLDINLPSLFGGNKSQGGLVGAMDIMFGAKAQTVNTYLEQTLSEGGTVPMPAYRGMVTTVANQMNIGTVTQLKRMDGIWRRTTQDNRGDPIWYAAKADILDAGGVHNMNIAHIVHEILTDSDYSLGFVNGPDDANFRSVADTLYDEGFGLSLVLDVAAKGSNLINELLSYANGLPRVNPVTNLYQIKLLRDDFIIDDLDILDYSVVDTVTGLSRQTPNEIFNQVVVNFTDPVSRETKTTIAQNQALIGTLGRVVSKTIAAPGVLSLELANVMATNALQSLSVNPFSAVIRGKRQLAKYNTGDPVRLQLPDDFLSDVVVRVLEVNYGTLSSGEVELKVTQDVFKAGTAIYGSQTSLWENKAQQPIDLTARKIVELPYYNIVNDIIGTDFADILTTTKGRPAMSGVRTAPNSTLFDTYLKLTTDPDYTIYTEDAVFCPYCETTAAIIQATTQLTIGYTNPLDIVGLSIDSSSWCQIDDEILKVISIDTSVRELVLERACLDTVPTEHAAGASIFFISAAYSTSEIEYENTDSIDVKFIPETTLGELDIASATADTIVMDKRYIRPYNGAAFNGTDNTDFDFTWRHRNRLTDINDIVIQSAAGITPEVGTTYTLTAKDNGVIVKTVSGLTGENYTYTEADLIADFGSIANAKLSTSTYHLKSTRGGHDSWQEWSIAGTSIT